MEADWSVEIGADLPRIVVPWSGAAGPVVESLPDGTPSTGASLWPDADSLADDAPEAGPARASGGKLETDETLAGRGGGAGGLRSKPNSSTNRGSGGGVVSFVDLRHNPEAVHLIEEAQRYSPLRRALVELNAPRSPVFTSKCDAFPLAKDEIDPFEFDADADCGLVITCYVDLVMRDPAVFASFSAHEAWLRQLVGRLRSGHRIRCTRVELVLRDASVFGEDGFGVTLYVAGCGDDGAEATRAWEAGLDAVLQAIVVE